MEPVSGNDGQIERHGEFDRQAADYEGRTGIADHHCRAIATAVHGLAGVPRDAWVLEIGAGTGQIGRRLVGSGCRYLGLDRSRGMLEIFRRRVVARPGQALLVQADGNYPWPIKDATVGLIFSSRAIHLLDPEHCAAEVLRCSAPRGAALIVGRVRRNAEDIRTQLRREMRRRVEEQGLLGRDNALIRGRLLANCRASGGLAIEPLVVYSRSVWATPAESIGEWRNKPGLAGIDLRTSVKRALLDDLEGWAQDRFGDLERRFECLESYVLEGVRITSS